MAAMLVDVKNALGITGDYLDSALQIWIDEVMSFLVSGGVDSSKITSGLVSRGVADLWDYGSGTGKLSPYFRQRAIQLSYKSG